MSYDRKCFELAESFMSDHPALTKREARTKELAHAIQTAIDDEIEDFETNDEAERQFQAYLVDQATKEDPTDTRSQAYAERMYEAADDARKRIREEGR